MRRRTRICCAALVVVSLFVCAAACQRVVLVTESSPIRIGNDCWSKIYTLHGTEWRLSDNRVQIPEGWYAVPPSFVAEEK